MSAESSRAVFLSYASQDAEPARRVCEMLRAAGVEVWFDQSELVGGDAWDQKIRRQIKDCTLFMPVISASTQARTEGYFRLEWRLADQRTHLMAKGRPFLLPVVIDDTRDADAHVPDSFTEVQWTRLPGGETSAAFCERVKRLLSREMTPAFQTLGSGPPAAPHRLKAGATLDVSRRGRKPWFIAALGATFVSVAVAIWQPWRKSAPESKQPQSRAAATDVSPRSQALQSSTPSTQNVEPSRPTADANSVAVLAFADMSPQKDAEYFSDGISEELLSLLAKIPGLKVSARTSAFHFKGTNTPIPEIAKQLGVTYVVEGSVRKAGAQLRIAARLLNGHDGTQVWGDDFREELKDVFALQDKIAGLIATNLSLKLGMGLAGGTTAAGPTRNLAAHDLYLRGRSLQTGTQTDLTLSESARLYEEAVRLDPDYALAWSRLAQVFIQMLGGFDRSEQTGVKARSAATKAMQLAPDLPEARLAMAAVRRRIDRDVDAAQRELDHVDRIQPNNAECAVLRVQFENARGNWDARLADLIQRAVELDPQNANSITSMGFVLNRIGRFADADALFKRSWRIFQSADQAIVGRAMNYLDWTGDVAGTLSILETVPPPLRLSTYFQARAWLLFTRSDFAAATADCERVRQFVESGRMTTSGPRSGSVAATHLMGQIAARQGNAIRATELYAEALAAAREYVKDFPDLASGYGRLLAPIHADRGEYPEALAAVDQSMRLVMETRHSPGIATARRDKAQVLVLAGRNDAAIVELRRVHDSGYAFGYRLRVDPAWEPLRGDPKFQQLMKEAEARANAQPRPKRER